jgi:hypothetical protein
MELHELNYNTDTDTDNGLMNKKKARERLSIDDLFEEIKNIKDKAEEIKNDYASRFSKAVGCTPAVSKSIESLYTKINEESERKISELDAQFKDVRKQTCSFFDTLLKNIKDNNKAVEKLKLALPNDAFSAKIVDEITASIKSHTDENTEIMNALTSFLKSDLIPKEIIPRVKSIIPKAKEPIGVNNYTIAEGESSTEGVIGVMAFDIDFDPFTSPYPDVFTEKIIIPPPNPL